MSEYVFEIGVREHGGAYERQREPIVRCRDCEWCVEAGAFYDCEHFACHLYWNEGQEPDGFCAWGERTDFTKE